MINWDRKILLLLVLSINLILFSIPSNSSSEIQLSGFGTFGIIQSNSDISGFRRSLDSPNFVIGGDTDYLNDTLVGVQLNAKIAASLDLAIQYVFKDRVEDEFENNLQFGFLNYEVGNNFKLRTGRMGLSLYLLSDHRDVGYTYLWARPVTEFYAILTPQYIDGFDVIYTERIGSGIFEVVGFFGETKGTIVIDRDVFSIDTKLSPFYGISLSYESGPWKWHLATSTAKIANDLLFTDPLAAALESVPTVFWPEAKELADEFDVRGSTLEYHSIGLILEPDEWVIQSEISSLKAEKEIYNSYISAYVSVGHRFGIWTPYVVVSKTYSVKDPVLPTTMIPSLIQLESTAIEAIEASRIDQKTISIGARIDIHSNLALKLQFDKRKYRDGGDALWHVQSTPQDSEEIESWSISLDYVF